MPNVFGIVLAGGEGKRLAPLTLDRAKPAVPFGGNYRLIDFALSNLVNAGFRQIVVLTQYKSHSLDRHISLDLAPVAAARQLRDAGAGADAARPALVLGLGRRDLPEPQPARTTSGPSTWPCSAPTTSTAWTRGRWSSSTSRAGAGGHRRGDAGADRRRPTSSASIETGARRPDDHRLPREAQGRRRAARRARPGLRLDGQLRVHHRGADRRGHGRRGRRRLQPRHGRQHHPDAGRAAAPPTCTTSRRTSSRARRERDHGYWRDVGTLDAYYDAHMDLVSVDPVFNLYNRQWPILQLATSRCRRPSSSSTRTAAAARRSTRWSAPAWSISGGVRAPLGALAGRPSALLRRGRGLGPDARRRRRPRRGRAQRDHRQERADRAGARRSASTPRPTASASWCPTAASS